MSSRIISFDALSKSNYPASIVLDTNFILNLTHSYTNHSDSHNASECNQFIKTLLYEECQLFTPQIVINEFCHQIYMNELSEYQHKHHQSGSKVALYKNKPYAIALGHNKINSAITALDAIMTKKDFVENGVPLRNKALILMRKYNLLPSDAFIGAIAIENKIRHIATLDRYFAKCISQEHITIFMAQELIY